MMVKLHRRHALFLALTLSPLSTKAFIVLAAAASFNLPRWFEFAFGYEYEVRRGERWERNLCFLFSFSVVIIICFWQMFY